MTSVTKRWLEDSSATRSRVAELKMEGAVLNISVGYETSSRGFVQFRTPDDLKCWLSRLQGSKFTAGHHENLWTDTGKSEEEKTFGRACRVARQQVSERVKPEFSRRVKTHALTGAVMVASLRVGKVALTPDGTPQWSWNESELTKAGARVADVAKALQDAFVNDGIA